MMIPPTFYMTKMLEASVIAAVPKSVGSLFRYKDAKNADPELKRNIARGEALTVAQVSGYSIVIDQLVSLAEKATHQSAQKSLLKTSLQKLTQNRPIFLMALGFVANYLAETVSRLKYKRDIGPDAAASFVKSEINEMKEDFKKEFTKDDDDHQEDPHHDAPDDRKRDGAGSSFFRQPNAHKAKSQPVRRQSVTFAQNPLATNNITANPFQFYFPQPVAKPTFSV